MQKLEVIDPMSQLASRSTLLSSLGSSVSSSEIAHVESLLSTLYNSNCSNVHRHEVEMSLNAWHSRSVSDLLALYVGTTNEMAAMFALNVLERLIASKWPILNSQDRQLAKQVLRQSLISAALESSSAVSDRSSLFCMKKSIKLMADIALYDWPHFYPDYFTFMTELIVSEHGKGQDGQGNSNRATVCALHMIVIAVEQLGNGNKGKKVISSGRRRELKTLMLRQVPQLMESVSGLLLQQCASKSVESSSMVVDLSLECLTQLVLFENNVNQDTMEWRMELLNLLFTIASNELKAHEIPSSSSLHALDTLLELMSRRMISPLFHSSMMLIINNALVFFDKWLHLVNKKHNDHSSTLLLTHTYVTKCTELLRLLVSLHLHRIITHDDSGQSSGHRQLLTVLFGLTFGNVSDNELFLSFLDIWTIYVDYMHNGVVNKISLDEVNDENHCDPMVKEALITLVQQLLKHLQFRHSHLTLHKLDQEALDEDEVSEWQRHVTTCIELVMHVAEILPQSSLAIIYDEWHAVSSLFLSLEHHIHHGVLVMEGVNELEHLRHLLLDAGTMVQLLGRMSTLFSGNSFARRRKEGENLFNHIVHMDALMTKWQFHKMQGNLSNLHKHFVHTHCQIMGSLRAWCHWLQELHSLPNEDELCKSLTSSALLSLTSVLHLIEPESVLESKLIHSALHFLVTLTGVVRPPCIFKLKEFTDLYNFLSLIQWTNELRSLLIKALANVLLLNWPGLKDQRWEERQRHLTKFVKEITSDFELLATPQGRERVNNDQVFRAHGVQVVKFTCKLLRELIESVENENSMVKRLCHECLNPYIDMTVSLLHMFVKWEWEACESLFSLITSHMDVLKNELNCGQVRHIINDILSIFPVSFVDLVLNENNLRSHRLIESFMKLLELVVKNNTYYYKKKRTCDNNSNQEYERLVEHTLTLCLDHVYPVVISRKESMDLQQPVYNLLHSTLEHNQRYFIKMSTSKSLSKNFVREEMVCHESRLMAAFEAIGQAFTLAEISVYKTNVEALITLNNKWNLFRKPFFKDRLSFEFVRVFLTTLLNQSHELLRDEIIHLIFTMAEVDFKCFYDKFVVDYLLSCQGIDDRQREALKNTLGIETDLPSFTTNLLDFVSDHGYYKHCNEAAATVVS